VAVYSDAPLHGIGRGPEEKMRIYLGCEKADDTSYDFKKGGVKFEYKHSGLHLTNKRSTRQPGREPTRTWSFRSLRGRGGKKEYHHLILEGERGDQGDAFFFLISFTELNKVLPDKNDLSVTWPHRPERVRGCTKFVWDHVVGKEQLKAQVDEYASSSAHASHPPKSPEVSKSAATNRGIQRLLPFDTP